MPHEDPKREAGVSTSDTNYVQYNVGNCSVVVSDDYVVKSLLGTGSYGVVVEAQRVGQQAAEEEEIFAIKKLRLGEQGDTLDERLQTMERVLREVKLLAHFDHYTIVALHDIILPREHDLDLCYVMDLMSTDLGCILHPQLSTADYVRITPSADCGATFDDKNVLIEVAAGSAAETAGFAPFVGRRALVIENRLRFFTNSSQYRISAQKITHGTAPNSIQIGFEPEKQEFGMFSIKTIMWSLLEAFSVIHACGVIHRDAKPQNILLSYDGIVKLCDFGLARELDNDATLTTYVETRWYRAPELLVESKKYDSKVDVWSLGCIFAELLHPLYDPLLPGFNTLDQLHLTLDRLGKPSREDLREMGVESEKTIAAILGRDAGPSVGGIAAATDDPQAQDLLRGMLTFLPSARMTVRDCMSHPFFDDYKEEAELLPEDYALGDHETFFLLPEEKEKSARRGVSGEGGVGGGGEGGGGGVPLTPLIEGVLTPSAEVEVDAEGVVGGAEVRAATERRKARLQQLTNELLATVRKFHRGFAGDFLLKQIDDLL